MNGCTDRDQIADLVLVELLAILDTPIGHDAIKRVLCQLIADGAICIPLPEALTFDCESKTLTLALSDGRDLSAELSCLPECAVASRETPVIGWLTDE